MKTAFVFPGQGSQFVGMGKDLYDGNPTAKEVYDLVDSYVKIKDISFNGPEDELKRTIYTQPAILAHSLTLVKLAKDAFKEGTLERPLYVAGHSLGEFAALYAASVLSLDTVIQLVAKRAELMETAPAGAMTAVVGLAENTLNKIVEETEGCSVANYNSPEQIVITGTKEGVIAAEDKIKAFADENTLKVRVIPLPVGGAFHSPLMASASTEFGKLIDEANFENAKIPVIQNFTGKATSDAQEIKENLKKQMTGAVQWTNTIKTLITETETIYELGPGKVLAGLVKKQDRRFPVINVGTLAEFKEVSLITK